MNTFSFWHKLAFILNCCWLAAWVFKYTTVLPGTILQSTILVNGLVIAYLVNIPLNLYGIFLLVRKSRRPELTSVIAIINLLFFLVQLYLLLK